MDILNSRKYVRRGRLSAAQAQAAGSGEQTIAADTYGETSILPGAERAAGGGLANRPANDPLLGHSGAAGEGQAIVLRFEVHLSTSEFSRTARADGLDYGAGKDIAGSSDPPLSRYGR
ncbi:hypothetical protein [[Acidovorax] ebreus]|jgi:hypothetical protein|uniref:hypothetical protein n=1 Tax=Diaphorobacter sp. LI3 TaxID=2952886 RepID=UPI002068A9DE|nr:hypothetical protein MRB47_11230 [Diaphorobacter sp. LI3]